jgi:hypothetical protein
VRESEWPGVVPQPRRDPSNSAGRVANKSHLQHLKISYQPVGGWRSRH